ncbi:MAG: hypothetical protein ACI4TM_04180 [Candidatus Cryptobacteroides sp.]
MIEEVGSSSKGYQEQCRPYAVFDYDNTTIMNDISMTLMIYQIENLRYSFSPEEAFSRFTAWLPDLDSEMDGPGMSASELGRCLADDYAVLKEMLDSGKPIGKIRDTDEYLDFRAKMMALNEGVENTFDYGTWCLWQPSLFSGMSEEELTAFTKESVDHWLSQERIWTEIWESPDGKVCVEVLKGLHVSVESLHLYKALQENGIDVYICSASLETVVEAMACDPRYGIGLSPDHVFGIRLSGGTTGGPFADDYDQTFLEGKTACIRKLISPSHGGADPSLVAGDSNGDYDMLTAFDSLKVGLIIDCGRSGPISELAAGAPSSKSPRYVVQGRDLSIPGYVR